MDMLSITLPGGEFGVRVALAMLTARLSMPCSPRQML
jgi:hypothetical protein